MDESDFRSRIEHLKETSGDPRLLAVIRDLEEGRIDRRAFYASEPFRAEVSRSLDAMVEGLREQGRLDEVRQEVRRVATEDGITEVLSDEPGHPQT